MKIGNTPLTDVKPVATTVIKLSTAIVWERSAGGVPGELVISVDGFLVKEVDGYLVK